MLPITYLRNGLNLLNGSLGEGATITVANTQYPQGIADNGKEDAVDTTAFAVKKISHLATQRLGIMLRHWAASW
jgi:hypothetical protein